MLKSMNEVFAFIDLDLLQWDTEEISTELLEKLEARNTAKAEKNYELADSLRDEIAAAGYKIIDDRSGSRIEKI